jgi:hypothetical protein
MPSSGGARRSELHLRLYVRTLWDPADFTLDEMIEAMHLVYAQAGIKVQVLSRTRLTLPALQDLDIGPCTHNVLTAQQRALFAERAGIGRGEVAVYFVRSTIPRSRGCAAHPEHQPGAVVTRFASRWTLAHEVGHVLGLGHTDDPRRLMTSRDTSRIPVPTPLLTPGEIATIRRSPWLHRP